MLEELQHNYPLELLMALSNAAISAMKVLDHVRFGDSARGWDHLAFDLAGCHLKSFRLQTFVTQDTRHSSHVKFSVLGT